MRNLTKIYDAIIFILLIIPTALIVILLWTIDFCITLKEKMQ